MRRVTNRSCGVSNREHRLADSSVSRPKNSTSIAVQELFLNHIRYLLEQTTNDILQETSGKTPYFAKSSFFSSKIVLKKLLGCIFDSQLSSHVVHMFFNKKTSLKMNERSHTNLKKREKILTDKRCIFDYLLNLFKFLLEVVLCYFHTK